MVQPPPSSLGPPSASAHFASATDPGAITSDPTRVRSRVHSDVILPGQVALAKWALAEGCPRERDPQRFRNGIARTMATAAAEYQHLELVKWLCGEEGGFAINEDLMKQAARRGNRELMQWLWGEGCPWHYMTCFDLVSQGDVELLRWARENGCPWEPETRDQAAEQLGYTDDLGNLGVWDGVQWHHYNEHL